MIRLLILILFIINTANAQTEGPHYSMVFNVYRTEKNLINEYAIDFITNNQYLFLYKYTPLYGETSLKSINLNHNKYTVSDSGIIANCIFVYKKDTIYSKIGFLSKENRTKVVILNTENYVPNSYCKEFIKNRLETIGIKYHKFLKTKSSSSEHW